MIEIHLYGKLRRYAPNPYPGADSVIQLEITDNETLENILEKIGIDVNELYTIFLNSKLLVSRSKMASHLGYQQVRESSNNWNLSVEVHDGDRLGLFGSDMGILVV